MEAHRAIRTVTQLIINQRYVVTRFFEALHCSILYGLTEIFLLTKSFRPLCGPRVDSALSKNA